VIEWVPSVCVVRHGYRSFYCVLTWEVPNPEQSLLRPVEREQFLEHGVYDPDLWQDMLRQMTKRNEFPQTNWVEWVIENKIRPYSGVVFVLFGRLVQSEMVMMMTESVHKCRVAV
jgi:hypothetical protein